MGCFLCSKSQKNCSEWQQKNDSLRYGNQEHLGTTRLFQNSPLKKRQYTMIRIRLMNGVEKAFFIDSASTCEEAFEACMYFCEISLNFQQWSSVLN